MHLKNPMNPKGANSNAVFFTSGRKNVPVAHGRNVAVGLQ
jgi:hypothetical protein